MKNMTETEIRKCVKKIVQERQAKKIYHPVHHDKLLKIAIDTFALSLYRLYHYDEFNYNIGLEPEERTYHHYIQGSK